MIVDLKIRRWLPGDNHKDVLIYLDGWWLCHDPLYEVGVPQFYIELPSLPDPVDDLDNISSEWV